jgi:hypothetical protein
MISVLYIKWLVQSFKLQNLKEMFKKIIMISVLDSSMIV